MLDRMQTSSCGKYTAATIRHNCSNHILGICIYHELYVVLLVAEAIPGEAENRLHNYCCVYADKASLEQPDFEGPLCSRPTVERPFSSIYPTEEVEWNVEPPPTGRL